MLTFCVLLGCTVLVFSMFGGGGTFCPAVAVMALLVMGIASIEREE